MNSTQTIPFFDLIFRLASTLVSPEISNQLIGWRVDIPRNTLRKMANPGIKQCCQNVRKLRAHHHFFQLLNSNADDFSIGGRQ
jgi:hypothetical protein